MKQTKLPRMPRAPPPPAPPPAFASPPTHALTAGRIGSLPHCATAVPPSAVAPVAAVTSPTPPPPPSSVTSLQAASRSTGAPATPTPTPLPPPPPLPCRAPVRPADDRADARPPAQADPHRTPQGPGRSTHRLSYTVEHDRKEQDGQTCHEATTDVALREGHQDVEPQASGADQPRDDHDRQHHHDRL